MFIIIRHSSTDDDEINSYLSDHSQSQSSSESDSEKGNSESDEEAPHFPWSPSPVDLHEVYIKWMPCHLATPAPNDKQHNERTMTSPVQVGADPMSPIPSYDMHTDSIGMPIVEQAGHNPDSIQLLASDSTVHTTPHILEWCTGDAPRRGECKEAPPGPPSLYIFTLGVARYIASQLYPETPSLILGTNVDTYGYIWICNHGYRYSMDTDTTISG